MAFRPEILVLIALLFAQQAYGIRNTVHNGNTVRARALVGPPNKSLELYNHVSFSVSYHNLGEEILTFPERMPRTFNVLLATFKTWAADGIVQFAQGRKNPEWSFDWTRSLAFATFGLLYIGLLQWGLYVTFLTWLFPEAIIFANAPLAIKLKDRVGQLELLGQVLVDNFIFSVLIYFPIFYMLKELVQGEKSFAARVQTGLNKYLKNIVSDNLASFAVWLPTGFFIFSSPIFLRMPLEHTVSFGWTMVMSAMRGKSEKSSSSEQTKLEAQCFEAS